MIEILLRRMARILGGADSANGRSLACVWGLGSSCLTATILLPHPARANEAGLIAIAAIAFPVAALMFVYAASLPRAALEAFTYLGQGLITALTLFWGAPDAPFLWFHVWLVVHSFHFLPARRATLQIACAAALFVVATIVTDAPFPAAVSVVGVGSIITIGVLVGALRVQVDELVGALAASAASDPLTGLANRRALADAYASDQARRARGRCSGALLVLDCDGFKSINDCHGHATGDRALCLVADVVSANIREVDTLARLGGDEFALLLETPDPRELVAIGERIRGAVAYAPESDGLTLSIGIVELPPDASIDLYTALAVADRAMYESKRRGGNCVTRGTITEAPAQRDLAAAG